MFVQCKLSEIVTFRAGEVRLQSRLVQSTILIECLAVVWNQFYFYETKHPEHVHKYFIL